MRGLPDPLLRPSELEEAHPRPVPTEQSARASTEHGLSSHLRGLRPRSPHLCRTSQPSKEPENSPRRNRSVCGTTENQGTLTRANPTHHPTTSRASLSRGQPRPPASPGPRCADTPTVRSGRGMQGGPGAGPRVPVLPVQQEEFRPGLPPQCGTHSWSVGGRPGEAKGEGAAGKSRSEERGRG